jgi:short-subunit dehydrogenase involved in D-alanine esterification of teichoic acids
MNILTNSVVFLTGGDGGIGKAFIKELVNRKVSKIYIAGLYLSPLQEIAKEYPNIVVPVKLNVTNSKEITECANKYLDVTILINNAGIELKSSFLNPKSAEYAKLEMTVNYIGVVDLTNQFINILKSNKNPAIVNILSVGSLISVKKIETYCASKTATHIFTQSIREELKNEITVFGVYPGYVDTSMVADINANKITPEMLVANICNDIIKGVLDIFPDPMSLNYTNSNKLKLDYL